MFWYTGIYLEFYVVLVRFFLLIYLLKTYDVWVVVFSLELKFIFCSFVCLFEKLIFVFLLNVVVFVFWKLFIWVVWDVVGLDLCLFG